MRGAVLPAIIVGLVVGIAQTVAPGTPAAHLVAPIGRSPDVSDGGPPAFVRTQGATSVQSSASDAAAAWKKKVSAIARSKSIGIAVRFDGDVLYEHRARGTRVPASNQKLLLSMALFDLLGPELRIVTGAAARRVDGSIVDGNLYVLGTGDPTITGGGRFATSLPIRPSRIKRLARHIKRSGIRRVDGRVIGSTNYFGRDWFAPGWRPEYPSQFVALPTALTFNGNSHGGIHISDPERRAAVALTRKLERLGVSVDGEPGAGAPPPNLTPVARLLSEPVSVLARFMNRTSSNFFAEVLGKRLGAEQVGRPGSIAKGAAAIRAWARARGVGIVAKDSSGLSYRNRISPRGLTKLLEQVESETWWPRLRSSLPTGDEGTLKDRLRGIQVRAKTGTLRGFSALSGWVWLKRPEGWAAFSILSAGMPKYQAAAVEDKIVRILEARAQ